jgi:transposase
MPPAVAILALLGMAAIGVRTGYEPLMALMFTRLGAELGWGDSPAASTFCRARQKVTEAMLDQVWAAIHQVARPVLAGFMPRVRGHRLVAIDGSWITVPNSKVLRRALGVHRIGPQRRSMRRPQVLLVVLSDAITRMPIARVVLRGDGSEREAARELLRHLRADDILLADRGYQGRKLLQAIHATGCRYVLRVPGGINTWCEFRRLQRNRIRDAKVTINLGDDSIAIRHVRVSGGPGRPRRNSKRETQFLITNLPATWSAKRIGSLYTARWGVETMFRELKCTLETNSIRASHLKGVIQELDVRCIHLAIAAYLAIAAIVSAGSLSRQNRITVNRSTLLLLVAGVLLQPDDDPDRCQRTGIAATTAARRAAVVREGRHAPRKKAMFVNR